MRRYHGMAEASLLFRGDKARQVNWGSETSVLLNVSSYQHQYHHIIVFLAVINLEKFLKLCISIRRVSSRTCAVMAALVLARALTSHFALAGSAAARGCGAEAEQ